MKVSIIIATKNRPGNIAPCIRSIAKNTYRSFEIIVVDQSEDDSTKIQFQHVRSQYQNIRTLYIHQKKRGISNARNTGIQKASGNIVIFTDDDCIVKNSWIQEIVQSFHSHPQIQGVYGKTLPFNKREGEICPCTFTRSAPRIISRPCYHVKYFGFGNNMAYRKSLFSDTGLFKTWLGTGSVGLSAEDSEFAQRILLSDKIIFYNPKAVVFHNKWLAARDMEQQIRLYTCGEMACYGYFCFQGFSFAKAIVLNNIKDSFSKLENIVKMVLKLQWNRNTLHELKRTSVEFFYRGRGLLVGFIYAITDPVSIPR